MADLSNKTNMPSNLVEKKRWQRILDSDPMKQWKVLGSSEVYRTQEFIPIYDDSYRHKVSYFGIKGSRDINNQFTKQVSVSLLRQLSDGVKCKLMSDLRGD